MKFNSQRVTNAIKLIMHDWLQIIEWWGNGRHGKPVYIHRIFAQTLKVYWIKFPWNLILCEVRFLDPRIHLLLILKTGLSTTCKLYKRITSLRRDYEKGINENTSAYILSSSIINSTHILVIPHFKSFSFLHFKNSLSLSLCLVHFIEN